MLIRYGSARRIRAMKQADLGLALTIKPTLKREFLAEMERVGLRAALDVLITPNVHEGTRPMAGMPPSTTSGSAGSWISCWQQRQAQLPQMWQCTDIQLLTHVLAHTLHRFAAVSVRAGGVGRVMAMLYAFSGSGWRRGLRGAFPGAA